MQVYCFEHHDRSRSVLVYRVVFIMHMYKGSSATYLSISARTAVPSPFDRPLSNQSSHYLERLVEPVQRCSLAPMDKTYELDFRDAGDDARLPIVRLLVEEFTCSYALPSRKIGLIGWTHVWHSAIRAEADLRLVRVDKYSRMSQWPSTSIAGYSAFFCPAHGLLMDQLDSCIWAWLQRPKSAIGSLSALLSLSREPLITI